jgi:transposase
LVSKRSLAELANGAGGATVGPTGTGVGIRTAEAIAAFIDSPDRFRNAKVASQDFGLVPKQDQSGDRNRLGYISREGPEVISRLDSEAP